MMDAKQAVESLRIEAITLYRHDKKNKKPAKRLLDIADLIECMQAHEAELVGALREAKSTLNTCEVYLLDGIIENALNSNGSDYGEYVRKLEAVAKAAEEAVPYDYITPELHEALADWRSNE